MDTVKCERCGSVYEHTSYHVPVRDRDAFKCDCGHKVYSWNEARDHNFRLIEPGSQKAQSN